MVVSCDGLVADPLFPRLKAHLVESTGLTYYADKDIDLARRVRRRLSIVGAPDCASYLDILCDPLRGDFELDSLIEEVTIGETYFFRHREHFDALRDLVFPDLIARNRANRRLRIWCAGCADGPEPYSLAILLKRDMGLLLTGWDVTILGTDINRRCLARAREGKFEEWAFRSTPEELKLSCFRNEGRLWILAPEYKECVSFQYHNLVEHSFPSLVNNLCSFDLIVCRNVMIYFGVDLTQRVIRHFHDCLVPGAWLLVGPSEPNMTHFSSFGAVNAPGVTLYRKPRPSAAADGAGAFTSASLEPPAPVTYTDFSVPNRPTIENVPPTLANVRRHDDGAWESATRGCEQLLKTDNLNSRSISTMPWFWNRWGGTTKLEGLCGGPSTWIGSLCWRTTIWDSFSSPGVTGAGQRSHLQDRANLRCLPNRQQEFALPGVHTGCCDGELYRNRAGSAETRRIRHRWRRSTTSPWWPC
jgi:chemotaxis protein methyltransferase CheR